MNTNISEMIEIVGSIAEHATRPMVYTDGTPDENALALRRVARRAVNVLMYMHELAPVELAGERTCWQSGYSYADTPAEKAISRVMVTSINWAIENGHHSNNPVINGGAA